MPKDPSTPAAMSGRRASSPQWSQADSKRRRKVKTCSECRRRKLHCDQATPVCGRCVRAGTQAACQYIDESAPTMTHAATPTGDAGSDTGGAHDVLMTSASPGIAEAAAAAAAERMDQQARQIEKLEASLEECNRTIARLVARQNSLHPASSQNADIGASAVKSEKPEPTSMLIKGNSFKTRFYGITFPESLIAYTPKLSRLSKDIVARFPDLVKVRKDLREIEARTSHPIAMRLPVQQADLLALLPTQQETDQQVRLYLDNYDNIYHIVHLPTFWTDYRQMWAKPSDASPHQIALVLLMVATAQCLRRTAPWRYTAKRSTAKETAIAIVHICENWLFTQPQKRVTVFDFQIRFLICLAKIVNGTKFKRTWADVGTLLRTCIAAGLHQDPNALSESKPTSTLDKEMRRKIWSSVLELELQTSFTRGMTSAFEAPGPEDCFVPINAHDDDLSLQSQYRPASRPRSEFTNASYLVVARLSFALRSQLNAILNDDRTDMTFDVAKEYTEKLEASLDEIPYWSEKAAAAPRALLHLNLYNCLLVLHDRHLRHARTAFERRFSKLVITDTTTRMLDLQRSLVDSGCHALQLLCQDHLRAILSVCHAIGASNPASLSKVDLVLLETGQSVARHTVDLLADRMERLGGGQQQLWVALVGKALIKTERSPNEKAEQMQQAVDRMTGLCWKILASQEPSALAALGIGQQGWNPATDKSLPSAHSGPMDYNTFAMSDIDALAPWTFDEWSFNFQDSPGREAVE